MKASAVVMAVMAFGFASAATQIPKQAPTSGSLTSHGCYSQNATTWKKIVPDKPLSRGACGDACKLIDKNVMALNGEDCYCGDSYPPSETVVDDKNCNYNCPGYPQDACGGVTGGLFYSVYNTGSKLLVPDDPMPQTTTSVASKPTTTAPGAVETIIETPTQSAAPTGSGDPKKGGSNTAGIAAGVVVGVVVIAAIAGGAFYLIRRRRNAEIEEEHRRNAAVNAFIGGSKPPSSSGMSMSDSRMDPTLAHRRMSDGSIADNQDYSRKILRVTNA